MLTHTMKGKLDLMKDLNVILSELKSNTTTSSSTNKITGLDISNFLC
jgi:hypothetical protein